MKQLLTTLASLFIAGITAQAQPQITFDQTTKELGTLLWHTPRKATFTLTNKGTSDVLIEDVRTDCGCTAAEWTRTTIGPGSTGTISATYDAEMLGHFSKGLAVYTNLSKEPVYLTLMGQVSMTQTEPSVEYPYQIGDYYLSTDNIEFDDVNRGEAPTFTLQIFNASKKSYRPELMHLPKYLTAESDPDVLRPGSVGRILVTLNSDALPAMGLTQTNIYLSRFMGDRVSKETELNVSATLLPEFSEAELLSDNAPQAVIDSTHITLGPLGKKKKASGELLLRNTGNSILKVKALQVYNPGISVSINKTSIKPGDDEKIKISVNSTSSFFKGRRRILIITNDPKQSKIIIDVTIVP